MQEFEMDEIQEPDEVKIYHSSEDDFSHYPEAKFFERFIAVLIDGFIVAFATKVISSLIVLAMQTMPNVVILNALLVLVSFTLPTLYQIIFLTRDGQTLGKKAMKIKVVYQDNTEALSVGTVMIREPIGKLISGIFLGIGFIVVLFGNRAWHDNIADTKVIKIK
tara:strand:- start:10438 stop:10929 length:492 start_codon:yes stop_codon:yes gene_type:complete